MVELLTIIKDIILPVFIIMTIGFVMQRTFNLDVQSLARLNIYVFVPGFIFVKLYEAQFTVSLFMNVLLFFVMYIFFLFIVSEVSARLLGFSEGKKVTFTNSIIFFNSGNYGVPVNDLVFKGDSYAMSIQVIVLTLQNIFLFSYGIFSMQSVDKGKLRALAGYFKMPVLYAMLLGVLMNVWKVELPQFVSVPVHYVSDALISIALITLGAQVAKLKLTSGLSKVYSSLLIRLVIGPLIALGIICVFGISGITAQALLIASAMPTAVNSAVIAFEYNKYPDFAAQIVLFSTLTSTVTVTFVIFMAKILF